jgi:DNA-binding transcriptional regulator GbsR (MarR family)
MVELTPNARKVYEALEILSAVAPDKTKSADQVMAKARMGKGQINSALAELQKKKIVKRIAKQKRAGYYILQKL